MMSRPNLRTLVSKTPATEIPEAPEAPETQQQHPRRIAIRQACQRCRKRRVKCDGKEPCLPCEKSSTSCFYKKKQNQLISDLLAKVERLERENAEKDEILKNFSFGHDIEICKSVIQRLKDGNKSRRDVLDAMDVTREISNRLQLGNRQNASTDAGPAEPDMTSQFCSRHLQQRNVSRCSPGKLNRSVEATATLSAPGLPTPTALPSLAANGHTAQSHADNWTNHGLSKTYIRQLFLALLSWDCLPFCIICDAPFLPAFDTHSTQFCSQALVNALIALAIRVLIETENGSGPTSKNSFGSMQFFDTAEGLLLTSERLTSLPDIQALGILSIYQISCGRETESEKLAQLFCSNITGLCNQRLPEEKDEEYILEMMRYS